jgi:hypothetical protein
MTEDPVERQAIIDQGLDIVWSGLAAEKDTSENDSRRKKRKE